MDGTSYKGGSAILASRRIRHAIDEGLKDLIATKHFPGG